MIDKPAPPALALDFETFASQSAALHQPGISAAGKRYKRHSHQALTNCFFTLIDEFNIKTAIEVGAFKGEFSQRFKRTDSNRTALAIEANPYNFNAFRNTFAEADILYHHSAVWDKDQPCDLQLSVTEQDKKNGYIRGNNSIRTADDRTETKAITVPGITLDSLVDDFTRAHRLPDLSSANAVLWLDVEGALDLVIRGAQRTLQNTLALFAEVESVALWSGQANFREICVQLAELDFYPFLRDCEYEPDQYNVIFLNALSADNTILQSLKQHYFRTLNEFRTQ